MRILIFYTIGIVLSNIFRFNLISFDKWEQESAIFTMSLVSLLGAIGLFIGGLLMIYFLKKERKLNFSLFGTSFKWSIIMMIIPLALLSFFGVHNSFGMNIHYYGLIGGVTTLIYCFFEEIGWRGYLQEELSELKEWKRVLLIGFLWYFWHLSFISNQNILDNIQFLGWMILGSWGLGKVISSTKSIAAVSCFHMLINIMMFNGGITNGLEGNTKVYILAIAVILWITTIHFWMKERKEVKSSYSSTS